MLGSAAGKFQNNITKFERMWSPRSPSVEQAGLVGGHHVFDVYEGVLSSVALQHLQSLLDQIADVLPLVLAVVDAVPGVN